MNYYSGLENVYLLVSRSHMESGLHGVKVGVGPGLSVGGIDGIGQSGCSMCFAGQ